MIERIAMTESERDAIIAMARLGLQTAKFTGSVASEIQREAQRAIYRLLHPRRQGRQPATGRHATRDELEAAIKRDVHQLGMAIKAAALAEGVGEATAHAILNPSKTGRIRP